MIALSINFKRLISPFINPFQPPMPMSTFPPSNAPNTAFNTAALFFPSSSFFSVTNVLLMLICANKGLGAAPTAVACNFVLNSNVPLDKALHNPPATLVGTVVLATTWITSPDLSMLGSKTRIFFSFVVRVPHVGVILCTPADVKLLRLALSSE